MTKNYYEILEVSENGSVEVIKMAYKTLSKKYHPDVCNESFTMTQTKEDKEKGYIGNH